MIGRPTDSPFHILFSDAQLAHLCMELSEVSELPIDKIASLL